MKRKSLFLIKGAKKINEKLEIKKDSLLGELIKWGWTRYRFHIKDIVEEVVFSPWARKQKNYSYLLKINNCNEWYKKADILFEKLKEGKECYDVEDILYYD